MQLNHTQANAITPLRDAFKKADFDLTGPAILGTMLGDDVTITIAVESVLKK